jgi:hypothetical protein
MFGVLRSVTYCLKHGESRRLAKVASAIVMMQTGLGMHPPPIYLLYRKKVMSSDTTSDKDNYKTSTLLVHPKDPANEVGILGGSENPEVRVKLQIKFDEIMCNMLLTTAVASQNQNGNGSAQLKGMAKDLSNSQISHK